MVANVVTIARYTLLEALRTRVAWMVLGMLVLLFAGSVFVQTIAVTESARLQTGFLAATVRVASVFIVAMYVVSATVREFNDRGLELLLSLDLSRTSWVLGKLAGFWVLALLVAIAAALPLALLSGGLPAALWGASLAAEIAIVATAALFCTVTLGQVVPAAGGTLAFYLLARSITAMKLMSGSSVFDRSAAFDRFVDMLVDLISLLVPRLDDFTRTAWLVDAAMPAAGVGTVVLQAAASTLLLAAATLFDFHRKEF